MLIPIVKTASFKRRYLKQLLKLLSLIKINKKITQIEKSEGTKCVSLYIWYAYAKFQQPRDNDKKVTGINFN